MKNCRSKTNLYAIDLVLEGVDVFAVHLGPLEHRCLQFVEHSLVEVLVFGPERQQLVQFLNPLLVTTRLRVGQGENGNYHVFDRVLQVFRACCQKQQLFIKNQGLISLIFSANR